MALFLNNYLSDNRIKIYPYATPYHFFTFYILFSYCLRKDKPVVNLESYPIPGDKFFPEGIAYDPDAGAFYTGSTTNGDVVKANVKIGAIELFASGAKQGRSFCTGMKLDHKIAYGYAAEMKAAFIC